MKMNGVSHNNESSKMIALKPPYYRETAGAVHPDESPSVAVTSRLQLRRAGVKLGGCMPREPRHVIYRALWPRLNYLGMRALLPSGHPG